MKNDYLFPACLTRRDFIHAGGAATLAAAVPGLARADESAPVTFGSGAFRYVLDENRASCPRG
jgi:hypothetical protein